MANQKKEAALSALIASNSLSEAAEIAGIDRRTLYNYLHNDLDFARAYDEIRDRQTIAYMDEMIAMRIKANKVIMQVLEDETQTAGIRLKAASMILESTENMEKRVSGITAQNITVNKGICDFSLR